jgi:hypothetical protein
MPHFFKICSAVLELFHTYKQVDEWNNLLDAPLVYKPTQKILSLPIVNHGYPIHNQLLYRLHYFKPVGKMYTT